MMGIKVPASLLAVFAAMAIIAGCGSDDGDASGAGGSSQESSGDSTSPKAEFIKQANAACEERNKRVKKGGSALYNKYGKVGEEKEFGEAVIRQVIIPEFEAEVRDLKALEPPAGDQEQLNEFYAAIDRMIKKIKVYPAADDFYPYKEAEQIAAKYGITECGHP